MIFQRSLLFAIVFLAALFMDVSHPALASPTRIKTSDGRCLSFGTRLAKLRTCNYSDLNQLIFTQKVNSTFLVMHNYNSTEVMCYDRQFSKMKIFKIKYFVKGKKLLRPTDVVAATRTNPRYDCGVHEIPANGYQYFKFGEDDAEFMVWKRKTGTIVKAKDMFCRYSKQQQLLPPLPPPPQKIRHYRSKTSLRSRDGPMTGKGGRKLSRSMELRNSFERDVSRRKLRNKNLESKNRSHTKNRRRRKNKNGKCRKVERDQFKQFIYDMNPSFK